MAITYVGGNKLSIAPSNSGSLSLTGLTGGSNSSPSQDDYVVVTWSRGFNSDLNMALSSAGYTELADLYADDNTDANLGVYIKKMGASPDATVDVATIGATFGGVLIAEVWRGVDLTTPMDVSVVTASGSNTALANPPAITPVTSGAVIVACGSAGAQSGTGDNASNFGSSDLTAFQTTFAAFTNGGMGYKVWSGSGSFDPAQWTCNDNIRSSWAAATLALRPAVTAVPITPNDATSAHAAEQPTIAAKSAISVNDAISGHSAESPSIAAKSTTAPADATHGHAAESPAIAAKSTIAPVDALHAHAAESPTIAAISAVTPADALHGHTAESPSIASQSPISPASALHGHTADSPIVAIRILPADASPERLAAVPANDRRAAVPSQIRAGTVAAVDRQASA